MLFSPDSVLQLPAESLQMAIRKKELSGGGGKEQPERKPFVATTLALLRGRGCSFNRLKLQSGLQHLDFKYSM